jgi:hypothetical protein
MASKEDRLYVMLNIRASHDEEYYKKAIASKGINIEDLTHGQISILKAAMDVVEADLFIEACDTIPVTTIMDTPLPDEAYKAVGMIPDKPVTVSN